jgi:hypothetical protein
MCRNRPFPLAIEKNDRPFENDRSRRGTVQRSGA